PVGAVGVVLGGLGGDADEPDAAGGVQAGPERRPGPVLAGPGHPVADQRPVERDERPADRRAEQGEPVGAGVERDRVGQPDGLRHRLDEVPVVGGVGGEWGAHGVWRTGRRPPGARDWWLTDTAARPGVRAGPCCGCRGCGSTDSMTPTPAEAPRDYTMTAASRFNLSLLESAQKVPGKPRHKTREVRVGDKVFGGGNPVWVQSMTTTDTFDVEGT